ncbi:MAG: M28 family peptidase [Candidatus Aminicenantes bacterium]|nr:MAG: M28 family peptidase [Candidatus Aminicenantes bacterium]
MRIYISLFLTFFLLFSPTAAKVKKVAFDVQAAWSYIKDLASDSMQGRKSGQPSGVMGEEYIASKFKEWGLEPAGDKGTYFQNFTIEHRNIEEGIALEIIAENARRDFYYGEDWRVQRFSGSGHFTAELVFVGYGIHAPDKEHDDYAGVDVKGKIVLFTTETPQRLEKKLGNATKMEKRIEAAQKLGARGAIFFRLSTAASRYFRVRLKKEQYKPDFVVLSVERKVMDFIFKDLSTEIRYSIPAMGRRAKLPKTLETGVKAFVSVNAIFDEKRPTRNVLAKITGSDKVLKDEYIVIGGHMDHLGISPMGDIMNGANDNASGTAVVMEIARVMKLNRAKPKRTVIFALWAGEEQGLLGSKHYADDSTFPMNKTVAYINMDMVGHGRRTIPFQGVYYGPQIWKLLKEKLSKEILDYVIPQRGGPGGSDHTPFLEKGVPGFFIITRGAIKYHQSRDDSDLIKPEMLKKTGDFVHAAVKILASESGDFFPPLRRETYYLKYQTLINFELSLLSEVVEHHKDAKDSHVDLQLAVMKEEEGLSGDGLRIDILEKFLSASEEIKKAKGLSYYSSSRRLTGDIRQGKTTIMAGLKGINAFRDDPRWAQVLVKQGLYFAFVEDPSFLFGEQGLSEEGKKIIKAVNNSGLLLLVKGVDGSQAKLLLKESKKPLAFLDKNLPDKEVMELIKEKESAFGLVWSNDVDPVAYFNKLDEFKKAVGTEYLMMVNEPCLWGKAGKDQMLKVITEIIKAKYDRTDRSNIYSSTFLRVLGKARGEGSSQVVPYMPF